MVLGLAAAGVAITAGPAVGEAGAILLVLSLEFAFTRTVDAARRLFLGSILYLPILWGILVWDHVAR